jgi:hypothetical protein
MKMLVTITILFNMIALALLFNMATRYGATDLERYVFAALGAINCMVTYSNLKRLSSIE